jgi:hypothetical protein
MEEVDSLSGLTYEQKERVKEIVNASCIKQPGLVPNVTGIANFVRSQGERPTPNTFAANKNRVL